MKAINRCIVSLVLTTVGCGGANVSSDLSERRSVVAERGAGVMPFDLDRTTHVFESLEDGGLQQITADSDDPKQVQLIREHLEMEAGRFAQGDFHDPSMIHGADMAGLHELVMGHERISVQYEEIEGGAQILYTTDDAKLVAAIHMWFEAQLSDHGHHAQPVR